MTTDAVLRREEVPAAFDTGAAAYDRLVGANPGYHAHLRCPPAPSLSDLHETTGAYEISVVKQGETGPLRL